MDVNLVCGTENEAAIKNMLISNGIGIGKDAELVIVEKGMERGIESGLMVVFEMRVFPALIELLKGAGDNDGPVGMLIGKSGGTFRPVDVEDVVYINAINNDVFIHDIEQNQYLIKNKLYQLEASVLPEYFIRINKSEIVNIKRIDKIVPMFKGRLILYLKGYKNPLDISRNYSRAFKERLGTVMIKKEYLIRMLFTMIISVAICALANTLFFDTPVTFGLIMKSVGLGVAIWMIAEVSLEAVSKRWPHHILPSYAALFLIIAIGTGLGSWLFGVASVKEILLICAGAEACGLLICVVYRRIYKKRLSQQLERFKKAH